MASITFTIPDAEAARILDGFAAHHKYQDDVPNPDFDPDDPAETDPPTIPNPQTKVQFLKRKIIEFVQASLKAEETRSAVATARGALPAEPNIT